MEDYNANSSFRYFLDPGEKITYHTGIMNTQPPITPLSHTGSTETGVLVIHGFTGNTVSVVPLVTGFQERGFHVEAPLLRGHGTHWEDLRTVTWQDWTEDVTIALETLSRRVRKIFVAGFSMGGVLACWLASVHKKLAGLILINHAFFVKDPGFYLTPFLRFILDSAPAVGNDIKAPGADERAYTRVAVKGAYQFLRLIRLVKPCLHRINQPVLIFKSLEDHVVPLKNVTYTLKHITSADKEICWLKNSYHVALLDNDREIILQQALHFIGRLRS